MGPFYALRLPPGGSLLRAQYHPHSLNPKKEQEIHFGVSFR